VQVALAWFWVGLVEMAADLHCVFWISGVVRILVKKGWFLIERAGFWAENGAKTRGCSYYLINRVKSYVVDCLVVS
jgi:hypothetical protein